MSLQSSVVVISGCSLSAPFLAALLPHSHPNKGFMRKSPCGASLKGTGNSQPHGLARSPSVPVPPHSEAWRAHSGGETYSPLEPFRQRPTGLRWQFYYYASRYSSSCSPATKNASPLRYFSRIAVVRRVLSSISNKT